MGAEGKTPRGQCHICGLPTNKPTARRHKKCKAKALFRSSAPVEMNKKRKAAEVNELDPKKQKKSAAQKEASQAIFAVVDAVAEAAPAKCEDGETIDACKRCHKPFVFTAGEQPVCEQHPKQQCEHDRFDANMDVQTQPHDQPIEPARMSPREFYAKKGWTTKPVKCKPCRQLKKGLRKKARLAQRGLHPTRAW